MTKFSVIAAASLCLFNYSTAYAVSATIYNVSDHCSCTGWGNPPIVCTVDNTKQDRINFYDMSVSPYRQIATVAPGEAVSVPLAYGGDIASRFDNLSEGYTVNRFPPVENPVGYALADTADGYVSSIVVTWDTFNPVTCQLGSQK